MAESADAVIYEDREHVAWLTIDRASTRNALGADVIAGLAAGMHRALNDRNMRAIVVTGAGDRAFSAGGNLKPGDKSPFKFDYSAPTGGYAELLHLATRCALPLIARVNGHCLAGGMGLLAMCDLAVASNTATFGLPEVKIGMFPMQVGAVIQNLIPRRKLMEMCITGEPITADEALAINLVNYVVPPLELDAKVAWLIARICDKSPTAVRRGRFAMAAIADMNTHQAIDYMATQLGTLALTEDAVEGLASFNQKRSPQWTGR